VTPEDVRSREAESLDLIARAALAVDEGDRSIALTRALIARTKDTILQVKHWAARCPELTGAGSSPAGEAASASDLQRTLEQH